MEKDLISVIIPVHNGQDYIQNCIESVVSKKSALYDLEIIVINDGSSDNTEPICKDLCEIYDLLKVITIEDLGVSSARNIGLNQARGNFITFVDADDRLSPGALEHLYSICKDHKYDFAGFGFKIWRDEKEYADIVRQAKTQSGTITVYSGNEYLDKGILSGDSRCWGKLYRSESIDGIRFEEGLSIGEDMLFLLDVVLKSDKIAISNYHGYGYFYNPNGLTWRPFNIAYMDQITCWQKACEQIGALRPDLKYRAAANILTSIMLTVGKIAMLPKEARKTYHEKVRYCREQIKEKVKVPGAFGRLSKGYQVKVRLFSISPGLYMSLYHLWKG